MLKNIKIYATAVVATVMVATPSFAQDQTVELTGDVELERTLQADDGTTTVVRVAPETIVPGDRLIFTTGYVNNGAEAVTDFAVTNPLPSAVRLAPDADAELVVSVDGGESWGTLETLEVAADDGSTRAASHSDVTHIRWTLTEVAAGESGELEYPAIIR